jgi:DNA repair protein SbcD/Mre11
MKILHFADAHIDMANYGRHDAETGLPLRVMDFLKSLDTIIDAAIHEQVDLVLFAGDAYKDRSPAPTFQREWGKRIMRLSQAGIPTLLLVGNHDLSPAIGRAHAIEEFKTLQVPHVRVLDKPVFLGPDELEGLPLQVLALPWISRSGLMANLELSAAEPSIVYEAIEERLKSLVDSWLENANPALPIILTAHASVQGAKYGGERMVMLGGDLVLSGSLVKDPRLDYVALGHIHKPQNLNENAHPPVVYPGSIERVDFGEAADDKFFVIAQVERGQTRVEWRKLTDIRPFIDRFLTLESEEDRANLRERVFAVLPAQDELEGAIFRLTLEYPREWEELIDEGALRQYTAGTFEFHLVKHPQMQARIRIPGGQQLESLPPMEILELYWLSRHIGEEERAALNKLAAEVIGEAEQEA